MTQTSTRIRRKDGVTQSYRIGSNARKVPTPSASTPSPHVGSGAIVNRSNEEEATVGQAAKALLALVHRAEDVPEHGFTYIIVPEIMTSYLIDDATDIQVHGPVTGGDGADEAAAVLFAELRTAVDAHNAVEAEAARADARRDAAASYR